MLLCRSAAGTPPRVAALFAALLAITPARVAADDVTVFAAASLKNAMDDVAEKWEAATEHTATVSFAGSSALARQIQQGAPADVFVSANTAWMDTLAEDGLIDSRFNLLRNSLVLIAHGTGADPVDLAPGVDLAGMLGDERLAMALVDAVPAGIYGKAALRGLGIWDEVAPKVAQADNVRAALELVSTGEAPMGIVYATDAVADDEVSVVGRFPADTHPPIIYPVAAIADSENSLNGRFLEFLRGPEARAAFERQGFAVIPD